IWPIRVPGVPIKLRSCGDIDPGDPARRYYLNINAFATPEPFTLGNMFIPPDVVSCGYLNEDFSVSKQFPVTERLHIRFGSVAGNIFNRVNFANVSGNMGTPASFGRVQRAAPARSVQLFLRVEF